MADKFALRREHTGNRQIDSIQQARNEIASTLNDCPFVRGKLVSFTGTTNTHRVITHGLGQPAAFFTIRQSYGGVESIPGFAEATDQSGIDPNNQIRVFVWQTGTVDLWFYPRASKQIDSTTGQSK